MSWFYSDNPVLDAERYADEQEDALCNLPVCECCGEPIQQEAAVYLDDKWYCDSCLWDKRKIIDF